MFALFCIFVVFPFFVQNAYFVMNVCSFFCSVNLLSLQHQQNKNQTKKPLQEPGIEPGTSCTQRGWVTTAPPSQLRVSIVKKLSNCIDPMGRNVNKQNRICGPDIFNKFIFFCQSLHA